MNILKAIAQRQLPDGSPLSPSVLECLSEAALGIMCCTQRSRLTSFGGEPEKATIDRMLDAQDPPTMIAALAPERVAAADPRTPTGACLCLCRAVQAMEESSGTHAAERLMGFIRPLKPAFHVLFDATEQHPMIGEMTFLLEQYLPMYCDYGLVTPRSLSTAIAQQLRDQGAAPGGQAATVPLLEAVSLSIYPKDLMLVAFQKARAVAPLEMVDGWIERTEKVIDLAHAASADARGARELSGVMNAGMIAYLLFCVVVTSSRWINKRYEEARQEAPADILRAEQVSEENRAHTDEALTFAGAHFISTPTTHLAVQLTMSHEIPTRDALRTHLSDGMSMIPIYPDALRGVWDEVLEQCWGGWRDDMPTTDGIVAELEQRMRLRFVGAFQDPVFARVALAMQGKWWNGLVEGR